jgi:sugar phosphate isomerase/epimerase
MIGRRSLLAGVGATATAALLGRPAAADAKQIRAVGLQLYTVRDLFAAEPVATLEKVARIGYKEVEFGGGGYERMDPAMLRGALDRLGLKAPSIHVSYQMLTDRFDATVALAKALGADTAVLPSLDASQRTEAGVGPLLESLNAIGPRLRAAGLGFAFHNHDVEFTTRIGGGTLYDRMVAGVNPAAMRFELDLYWARHAGADVAGLIQRLGSRLYAFHVKDMRPDRSMTAVGQGVTDFAALFRLPGAAGVQHFYVENDEAPAPYLPDITTSARTLRALRF